VVHLPPSERLLNETNGITLEEERLWWMWSMVGQVLWEEVRWREGEELDVTCRKQGYRKEVEELGVKVLEARRRVPGEEHPDTILVIAILAHTKKDLGQNDPVCDGIITSLGRRSF
jgi:hypothetical protein